MVVLTLLVVVAVIVVLIVMCSLLGIEWCYVSVYFYAFLETVV